MQFAILNIIRARDSLDVPNLQGAINHERTTHGGRTEHVLALLIIHHPLLLDRLRTSRHLPITQPPCAVFIQWGAGDATLGTLGSFYFPRPVWTYLVEKNADRFAAIELLIAHAAIPHSIRLRTTAVNRDFTTHPDYLQLEVTCVTAGYLNNYEQCLLPESSSQLAQHIDNISLPGSTLICLDNFFFGLPQWEYAVYEIEGLPRGQMSWLCQHSHPELIMEPFYIYKYTKANSTSPDSVHPNRDSQQPTQRGIISFTEFTRENSCS